jgi:2-dehydropantoate 2-reductase
MTYGAPEERFASQPSGPHGSVKNTINPSGRALRTKAGNARAAATEPAVRTVFLRAVREASAVAAAHGYPVESHLDLSRWGSQRGGHKPSLLQDYEHGRPMEIGEMVVAPAAFAEAVGVDTPTLATLAALSAQRARDRGLYATG